MHHRDTQRHVDAGRRAGRSGDHPALNADLGLDLAVAERAATCHARDRGLVAQVAAGRRLIRQADGVCRGAGAHRHFRAGQVGVLRRRRCGTAFLAWRGRRVVAAKQALESIGDGLCGSRRRQQHRCQAQRDRGAQPKNPPPGSCLGNDSQTLIKHSNPRCPIQVFRPNVGWRDYNKAKAANQRRRPPANSRNQPRKSSFNSPNSR